MSATQPLLCRRLLLRRRHDPEQQGSAHIAPTSTRTHNFLTLTGTSHVRLADNSALTHLHLFLRPAPSPLLRPAVVPPIRPIQQHTSPPLRPTWRPPLSSCWPHQDHTLTGYSVHPISILGKVLQGSVALTGLNLAGIRSQPHMSPHVHYARLKFQLQAYVILTI